FLYLILSLSLSYLLKQALKQPIISNYKFKVVAINNSSYYLQNKQAKKLLYTQSNLKLKQEVTITKPLTKINSNHNEYVFSYDHYLRSINIHYQVKQDFNISSNIKGKTHSKGKIDAYFNYLMLNDQSNFNQDIKNQLAQIGIIHLVVVSGMHFNIIIKLLNKVIIIKKPLVKNMLITLILFWYLNKLAYSYPSFKAFLSFVFSKIPILNKLNDEIKFILVFTLIISLRPLALINQSFIFTLIIAFFQYIIPKSYQNKIVSYNGFFAFILLPIIANNTYYFNPFTFIYNIVFNPLVKLLYYLIIFAKILPWFSFITLHYINFFEKVLDIVFNHSIFINIGAFSNIVLIIYYLLLVFLISKQLNIRRVIFIQTLLVMMIIFSPNIMNSVTFVDVGQADCIIIRKSFSNKVMMIDVGQPKGSNTIKYNIIPYLKAHKIKEVELLVISHDDIDHSGGLNDLKESYQVAQIIKNKTKDLYFQDLHFIDLLSDITYSNDNDNSLTLYTRFNNLNYLFTGDIGIKAELDYLKKTKQLPVDILKVAHHGSKYSTSNDFISFIKPRYAIISVGYNN
ncbi:MAG: ComEC/Rec2 family competence protein, partial [Bacilli bacterium]